MSDSMPPPEGQPEGQQPPQPGDVPPPPPAYGQAPPGQPGYPAAGYGQPTYGQPTYGQPTYGAPAPGMLSPADERTWGAGAHWSALVALRSAIACASARRAPRRSSATSTWSCRGRCRRALAMFTTV